MLGLPDVTRACLFDLDGVLTDTASVHAAAWKQMFDDFLREHAERAGAPFEPFDVKTDYGPYVDGKPRLDGTRAFLASRGITLPEGEATDGPDDETINGLATRKNELVHEKIRTDGVDVYPGSVRYLHAVRDAGLVTAVVSSSANAEVVLQVAGLADLIDHRVDGVVAKQRHLPGKPAPDTFLAAAADLDVPKEQAVVFEDALAGVAAGKAGGFGFVVGVDRLGQADALREHGADVVVADLVDLLGISWRGTDESRSWTPVHRRAVDRARAVARHGVPRRHRDRLRAVQRPHGPARQPRRGGAARHAGHLPQLLLRAAAAAVRRGRVTATRSRARRSSMSPTARSSGCWWTTSRSTCATARCTATSACWTCSRAR